MQFLIVPLLLMLAAPVSAQLAWPKGKVAAIVLTYDDSLRSQLDVAVPQLDEARLKSTFFLSGGNLTPDTMLRWRAVADAGHELGNHSVFHPCPRAILPDRPQYSTESYDVGRMLSEIRVTNLILFGIDEKRTRTFSAPCSQTLVGGIDYTDDLRRTGLIRFARTGGDQWNSVITDVNRLDVLKVPSYGPVDHPRGAELIAYAERVRAAGGLGVFQFHGVGGDYLEITAQAHQQLIDHLRKQPDLWVGTFQEVMAYVSAHSR